MTKALQQLMPLLERLTPKEREELSNILSRWEEPEEDPADVEAAWKEEVDRRVEEIRSGKAKGRPADEVFADLRKKLKKLPEMQQTNHVMRA